MFFFEATTVSRNDASVLLVTFHYNSNVAMRRRRVIFENAGGVYRTCTMILGEE